MPEAVVQMLNSEGKHICLCVCVRVCVYLTAPEGGKICIGVEMVETILLYSKNKCRPFFS